MTAEEATMYQQEVERKEKSARLISECLVTLERFCYSMPLDWLLGKHEFVAAFLHLLREPSAGIQIKAAACLEQLVQRKLDVSTWRRLILQLPQSVGEANAVAQTNVDESRVEAAVTGSADSIPDTLTVQLEFHRGLSRMLALLISAHLANITTNKKIMSGSGPEFESVTAYLRLMADMLHHPSGRIAAEQINMWIGLLKDPHNARSGIMTPFAGELFSCYTEKIVRVRWDDVEEEKHPQSSILGASWDDEVRA
jgi:signal transduction histidine kinase